MNKEEMPRLQKAILFVMCNIENLIDKGLMDGPKLVTEGGWQEFKKLEKEGFRPTDDERLAVMKAIGAI